MKRLASHVTGSVEASVYQGVGVGRSPYLNGVVARVGKDRVLVRLFTQ